TADRRVLPPRYPESASHRKWRPGGTMDWLRARSGASDSGADEGKVDVWVTVVLVRQHQLPPLRRASFPAVQRDTDSRQRAESAATARAGRRPHSTNGGTVGGSRSE